MIDVVYYLFNLLRISNQRGRLMLPKWIKVSEERFDEILCTVAKAKNEGLKTSVDGGEITQDNTERLLKDLGNGILDGHEFKKKYNNIVNDVEAIVNRSIMTRTQNKKNQKKAEIISLLKEISPDHKKSNKQPDTTNMPELDCEESAAERRNQQG